MYFQTLSTCILKCRQGGKTGDYGEKASADLIVTRGDGFRKEKNKKKRGSYRGGEITVSNTSPLHEARVLTSSADGDSQHQVYIVSAGVRLSI